MKPRLLNLAAAVSLLLALAILGLWVRSYWRPERAVRNWHTSTEQRSWQAESRYGSLDFVFARKPDKGAPIAPSYTYWDETRIVLRRPRPPSPPFPPVRFDHFFAPYDLWFIHLADWLLLPPTLVLPVIAIVRHRRRRRRERGNLCLTCGYDLRASPERCPECGTVRVDDKAMG